MPTIPHAIERPGGQVPITPPDFSNWQGVQRELKLGEASKRTTNQELTREALKIYRTIAESPNLPDMMLGGKSTPCSLAILATILGERVDISRRFDSFGLSISSLGAGYDNPMGYVLSLLIGGNAARIKKEAEKFQDSVEFEEGLLHWLLREPEKSETIFSTLWTNDTFIKLNPHYAGIIAHILGYDNIALSALEEIQEKRNEYRKTLWQDGIIVLDDEERSPLIEDTVWTAIFYVMMAGVDLRELIPK
jgi:hypothetical protein